MKKKPFELTKIGSLWPRFNHRVFSKHYHKKEAKRLNNTDFSLICSNCIAGVFYNFYHLKFLSPTINTDFNGLGFLKFANNIQSFLAYDLVEKKTSKLSYPVGYLNGLGPIIFPHCDSFEEAKKEWDRRKIRINYDNIIIIWNAYRIVSEEQIRLFDSLPYKKVCYTIDPSLENHQNCVFLNRYKNLPSIPLLLSVRNLSGVELFEYYFDLIAYINGEEFDKCLRHKGK
jgi:uncharacterized protein (DUF1919 family)